MNKDIRLHPFPHQEGYLRRFLGGETRVVVAVCGRGWGKTELGEMAVTGLTKKYLNRGGLYEMWWATTTKTGSGRKPWRYFKKIFGPRGWFTEYKHRIDNQENTIEVGDPSLTKDTISVRLRPTKGKHSSELEGDAIHLLAIDEAGSKYMKGEVWKSLWPAVTRVNGQAYVMGTVPDDWNECVGGWYRDLWDLAGETDGWEAITGTTFENPVYGGYILPAPPSVGQLSTMKKDEIDDIFEKYRVWNTKGAEFEEVFHAAVSDETAKRCLWILCKGEDSDMNMRRALLGVMHAQHDALADIRKLLNEGQAEEAERIYEAKWLERPLSIGDAAMGFVEANLVPGAPRYIMDRDGCMEPMATGSLIIWEEVDREASYVISLDPAGGVGGDYSVILVIKRPIGAAPAVVVAQYRTNIMAPDDVGIRTYWLAKMYNDGLIVAERTGAWGIAALCAMRDTAERMDESVWLYDDASREPQLANGKSQDVHTYGWNSSKQSCGMALTLLRNYLNTRHLIIKSAEIHKELASFDWELRSGNHDDTVMALAIGLQAMEWVGVEKMGEYNFLEDEYWPALKALAKQGSGRE